MNEIDKQTDGISVEKESIDMQYSHAVLTFFLILLSNSPSPPTFGSFFFYAGTICLCIIIQLLMLTNEAKAPHQTASNVVFYNVGDIKQ